VTACWLAAGSRRARRQASVNDFIIKAAAAALRSVPAANAYWTPDAVMFHATVDVAFAAATPAGLGEAGLGW
jgi:pyruvate dehydrogenase E2 component (dihydrolipoamide acetyltransferase)